MDKFGFIIHPIDSELMTTAFQEPGLNFADSKSYYKKRTVERALRWFSPFKCSDITGIKSITGKEIKGFFIFCPLIPEQILNMDQEFVLQRTIESCRLAEKLGAKIIGLGAYVSQVGRKGALIAKKIHIPVTIGTAYTIAIAVDSTLKAAKDVNLNIADAIIAVIGASGGIGSIFSRLIAPKCKGLILTARNVTRLKHIADMIEKESHKTPTLMTDVIKAVNKADIVMFSTNDPHNLIKACDLKAGAIICDMSIPKNVSQDVVNERKDILVIDGGIVKPPGNTKFNFYYGPPEGSTYACIAETMILTLEERFENYSIGGNITIEKVLEIKKLADKHGFKLSKFRSFYEEITKDRLWTTRKAIAHKFSKAKA
jgi:fatty aldehyde-generating acyl-ACP reductase